MTRKKMKRIKMKRKDMVASLVHFCDNCDNCHICPGNEFCIGMAEECDAIGESVFAILTDAEVDVMYLKCIGGGRQ